MELVDEETSTKQDPPFGGMKMFYACASTVIAIVSGSLTVFALHDLPEYFDECDDDGKKIVKNINIMLLVESGLMLLYGLMSTVTLIRHHACTCTCTVTVDEFPSGDSPQLRHGGSVAESQEQSASQLRRFYTIWAVIGGMWWVSPGMMLDVNMILLGSHCHRPDWLYLSVAVVNVICFTLLGSSALLLAGYGIVIGLFFAGLTIYWVPQIVFFMVASCCSAMGCTCLDHFISDFENM